MPFTLTLTVVMPVYNERPTLRAAVERMLKTQLPVDVELLVVDDGSTDGCIEEIQDLADSSAIRLIRLPRNQGKGAAMWAGIKEATGEILTILDADLEYEPADYADLLKPLLAGEADVIYGTRSFGAHTAFSFWFVLGNKLVTFWASFLFDAWLTDVETCFKMAKTDLWRSLDIKSKGFGIEAEATGKFLKGGHRIYEVPINYKARSREEGKKLHWTDGLQALWILLRVRLGI
ncbi:MAG: glycosyltransferase family 2 protein [Actinomycetota bacterium]